MQIRPTGRENGSEYYWHHQQQLQNSALTFQANFMEDPLMPHRRSEQSNTKDSLLPSLKIKEQCCLFKKEKSLVIFAKEKNAENLSLPSTNNSLSHCFLIITSLKKQFSTDCERIQKNQLFFPQLTARLFYKNHQLFIQKNQAELSLNTGKITKNKTKKLIQIIKKWLRCKRFYLRRLLINGEEQ